MNRDKYKLVVIMTHYNSEDFIRKPLDSLVTNIMGQNEFETIIGKKTDTITTHVLITLASHTMYARQI